MKWRHSSGWVGKKMWCHSGLISSVASSVPGWLEEKRDWGRDRGSRVVSTQVGQLQTLLVSSVPPEGTWMWGPSEFGKSRNQLLVHITPISLWFMVLITSYNYSSHGVNLNQRSHHWGGPHCNYFIRSWCMIRFCITRFRWVFCSPTKSPHPAPVQESLWSQSRYGSTPQDGALGEMFVGEQKTPSK